MNHASEIKYFIHQFSGAEPVFLEGCCYWFAMILCERFGGTIRYAPIDNHFFTEISGRYYDIRGDITDKYIQELSILWNTLCLTNNIQYARIVRDCIKKLPNT